jgi:hypothetical protein
MITQGNKNFFAVESCGRTVYYVGLIDGKLPHGRQGSYVYLKCDICGKIIGTQFNGYLRHVKTHEKKH